MKTAFLFPGQGVQYTGMGRELCEHYSQADEIFNEASSALNLDMKKLCFNGPDSELIKTENTQPAVLTTSMAVSSALKAEGIKADIAAGLSLGEYSALVEAGAMSFKDAVKVVRKRGRFMQDAVPMGKGGMVAIMGMDRQEVADIVKEAQPKGIIESANYNYPGQIVVSGEITALEEASRITQRRGGKAVALPVSAPFHCSMLKEAGRKLAVELRNVPVQPFNIPVIANVTADTYSDRKVKELLIDQVSSAVLWEDTIMRMIQLGVKLFIEVGPGRNLGGFLRKISRKKRIPIQCYSVEDMRSLHALLREIK